jgi:hypothetical protein
MVATLQAIDGGEVDTAATAVLTAVLSTLSMRTNRCGETLRALRLADIEGAHLCPGSPSASAINKPMLRLPPVTMSL